MNHWSLLLCQRDMVLLHHYHCQCCGLIIHFAHVFISLYYCAIITLTCMLRLPRSASDRDQIVDNTLRSHLIKNKTITIMNLIATLGIIYTHLYNCKLSWVSAVTATAQGLLLHTDMTWSDAEGGEYLQQQRALGLCSVRNIGHSSCHHLLDGVNHSLLHSAHWPTNSHE